MSTRRKLPARPKEQKSSKPDKATAKPTKRAASKPVNATLASLKPDIFADAVIPPARTHASLYHYPLLLNEEGDGGEACGKLLEWFEGIEGERDMPWRKDWIDPESFVGKSGGDDEGIEKILARRAYEVWVSEIMLQQTRVSTVIPYFKTWISRWPTVEDLAAANPDEVLSVWKGLGYYSRATRLHQGAQEMIAKNSVNPVPSGVVALQEFPGIGRYTAGAISSIAFGEPEALLDGNVARVLSRQLGLYVDAKDKKSTDFMWMVADGLVKHVSGAKNSKVPGQWNQALMELGSTICAPRPKCEECPIQKTCRAYAEGGELLKKGKGSGDVPTSIPDIEDACSLCEQLDTEDLMVAPEEDEEEGVKVVKKRKQETKATSKISHYFAASTPKQEAKVDIEENDENVEVAGPKKRKAPHSNASSKYRATYCSLFPKKMPKKKVAEEECVVCIVKSSDKEGNDKWLIEQRPAKGLLASLWQFPQSTIPDSNNTASQRKTAAQKYVKSLDVGHDDLCDAKHIAELDSLVHVFTHLKLTMHVHFFTVDADTETAAALSVPPTRKWTPTDAMDDETLSTGMRRCWDLAKSR